MHKIEESSKERALGKTVEVRYCRFLSDKVMLGECYEIKKLEKIF
ncbi:MAG: hypothetical protein U9O89_02555 [Thermoproteota archaeon]|nr:hypothetical protein [Thermoproteota archaeon]